MLRLFLRTDFYLELVGNSTSAFQVSFSSEFIFLEHKNIVASFFLLLCKGG